MAAAFCLFDKKLSSSGNSSVIWGALNLLIGGVLITRNDAWGAVSLVLGMGLVVAGLYQKKVRDPKVVIVAAATLAALGLWNLTIIALAVMGKAHLVMGGRTLFWAVAQLLGAYTTWKTYTTYKTLREQADDSTVQQVRAYIDEMGKAKPTQSLDQVEFEASAGFTEGNKRYRLKPVEDLYAVMRYKSQVGSTKLEEVGFVPRNEVTITMEGEKFMSKKIKATVRLGPTTISKVSITPEMAARMDPAIRTMSISAN
jgi:hypothetical protein